MIKNILLDIGGVIADGMAKYKKYSDWSLDELKRLHRVLMGSEFDSCMRGEISMAEYIEKTAAAHPEYATQIHETMEPRFYHETYPIMPENLNYVRKLRERGFKIYWLSNTTHETRESLRSILDEFDGGTYSYEEHLLKPDARIYQRALEKYNLAADETVFFDDNEKNVQAAREAGIESFVFREVGDIEKVVKNVKAVEAAEVAEINVVKITT